jgi:Uma2 family endonuclease
MYSRLERGLEGKSCKPFIAPTDVKLSDLDVVQPDILVVCDAARVTPTHIEDAPDVVIEVLSPATSAKDLRQKKTHGRFFRGCFPMQIQRGEPSMSQRCIRTPAHSP